MKRLIFTLLLLCLVATGFKCSKESTPGIPDKDVFNGQLSNDHTLGTPKGAIIASARSINPSFAPLVDGGLDDLFRIASLPPNNYDVSSLSHRMYRIWLYPRSSHCENPAFLVNGTGSPYEGTEWDKDPSPTRCLLCAAGMTVMQGYPTITGAGMVITNDTGIMRTIVRYEGEHSLLFYLDPERYNATQYHAEGSGHPILGDGPAEALSKNNYKIVALQAPIDVKDSDGSLVAPKGRGYCVLLTK